MALQAYLTEQEYQQQQQALGQEPVKAAGVEYARADDGNYRLVVTPREGFALEDVKGLRATVERTREERDGALRTIKAFGDLKPEDVPGLRDKATRFDGLDGKVRDAKAQFEEWKAEHERNLTEQHQAQLKERDAAIVELRAELDTHLIVGQATQLLAAPDVKGNPDLLLPVIRNQTEVREEQDQEGRRFWRVAVLNPAKPGRERIGKTGGPMTLEELIHELRAEKRYAGAFEGSGASGAGTTGAAGAVDMRGYPAKRSEFTTSQKVKFVQEHGSDAFLKLPV